MNNIKGKVYKKVLKNTMIAKTSQTTDCSQGNLFYC